VYIEKGDGRQRPLGVAALEDKVVQQAVVTIFNQIYEEDFLGFSRGKLQQIKQQLRKRMHDPVPQTGEWLKSVVQGYFNYYAVPGNMDSLRVFRARVTRLWRRILLCRSQTHRLPAARMYALEKRWLPVPRALHLYSEHRFAASHPR
jgi:RNA-directed DNA polymerase